MNAVSTEPKKQTGPVTQVSARLPRHAAIQDFPDRWMTMKAMHSSTLHMCALLTQCPTPEPCHHCGPSSASRLPVTSTTTNAGIVATPNA